jgi:hypothetical protein
VTGQVELAARAALMHAFGDLSPGASVYTMADTALEAVRPFIHPADCPEHLLDAPALVGSVRFAAGIPERLVIDAAITNARGNA